MKGKWVVLSSVLLGCAVLAYLLLLNLDKKKHTKLSELCIKEPYFQPVEITGFFSQIPCVDIKIDTKIAKVKVDLGFYAGISLPKEFIQKIDDKSFIQSAFHLGIRGKKYSSDVYQFPEIMIGKIVLFLANVQESNPEFEEDAILIKKEGATSEYLGRIGWPLFHNFNFFLDCQNSLIAFCDSLDTLKKQGYPVDSFIETPLLLERNLIEFEAMTETGAIRCVLDTGSTLNVVNKNEEGGSNKKKVNNIDKYKILNPTNSDKMVFDLNDVQEMSVFKIGKKDFGPMSFQKIKVPLEIDAIIGMEFLESTLVFIDFPNRKIYFYECPTEQ